MRRPKVQRNENAPELVSPELIERCRQGDEQAWAQLVGATHREVYTLCLRILRDPDDAAEATQDVYLKAWKGMGGFRGDAMFTTWLYRIAVNAAISKQRGRRRRQAHETGGEDDSLARMPARTSTEDAAGARLELQSVEAALASLPEHYRAAVVLRDVQGLSIQEMAKLLGVSETAAKVRVHRARKKLKEMLYPGDAQRSTEDES